MRGNKLFKVIDRLLGIPLCFILGKIKTCRPSHLPKSILLIKLSALGDTILLIPALRAIRKAYPKSFIGLIVTEANYQVIEGCPYIDELIFLDIKNPGRFIGFILNLRRKRFDLAIDFDQWLRLSPILAWLSGAKIRLGFKTEGQYRHYLYTAYIDHTRDKHEVLSFLSLLSLLKIETEDTHLEIWLEDRTFLEDFPTIPISPYGITKLCVEKYLKFYQETYGMNSVILRYANVYGRRQDPFGEAGVVAIFIQKMLSGERPTIFGDGSQERDYVYVDDVVEANLSAITKDDNLILNIGTGVTTSVQELFYELQKITGFSEMPIYATQRAGELQRSCLDGSKAKQLLAFIPKTDLAKGLKETVEYFRK